MVTLDEAGRGAERARVGTTGGPASALVEHDFGLDFREVDRTGWKVLPDPAPHLLVHFEQEGRCLVPGRLALVGARTRAIETDVSRRAWTVGLRLRPGALPLLTGLPADDLTDRAAPAADVLLGDAFGLEERVREAAASGPLAVRAELLRFLGEPARCSREVSWVAAQLDRRLCRSGGGGRISALAGEIGVAPRTLRVRSRAEVGLSPKRFGRIRRLFRAIETAAAGHAWAEVAARCGFVDQPHLVREFRALLDEPPVAFGARASS